MRRDPFQAIADPTRREIIKIVSQQPLNLNAVASRFDISRPAISKQIRILTECGLITIRKEGRERYCEANLRSLKEVEHWLEPYRIFWTTKLDALENFLNKNSSPVKAAKKRATSTHLTTSKKTKQK